MSHCLLSLQPKPAAPISNRGKPKTDLTHCRSVTYRWHILPWPDSSGREHIARIESACGSRPNSSVLWHLRLIGVSIQFMVRPFFQLVIFHFVGKHDALSQQDSKRLLVVSG